jgi:hypothetical protein
VTSPAPSAPVGPSALALQGAADAWTSAAVPPELHARFLPALTERLRSANYPHPELGGEAGGAGRVRVGARAVDLLTRHGYVDPDLLLAALLLPWCDPAAGGHREFVATRPVIGGWADAALLATVSALPRPGEDPLAQSCSYLRHLRTLPPELVAMVVAVRRAWVEAGPPDRQARFDELLLLAADVPAGLRDEVVRPLTVAARLLRAPRPPVHPPDLSADPITHPDVAVERALGAEPSWDRKSLVVAEYDIGYLIWPAQSRDPAPEPGGRVPAVIVDRQTHAATSWWELTAEHAALAYQARHRHFPLLPGWRAADRGPVEDGLDADLASAFPESVLAALAPVSEHLTAEYRDALRHGGRWPELVADWRVGVRTVSWLLASEVADPEMLRAPFVVKRELGEYLAFPAAVLAHVPATQVGETAYVDRLRTAPPEVRAVAVAYQLAAAEYAQTRFGGVCGARRADLGRMLALTADLPALRVAVASWSGTGSPGGAP